MDRKSLIDEVRARRNMKPDDVRRKAVYDLYIRHGMTSREIAEQTGMAWYRVKHDIEEWRAAVGAPGKRDVRAQDAALAALEGLEAPEREGREHAPLSRRDAADVGRPRPHLPRRRGRAPRVLMRGCVLDIETTSFTAESYGGYLIAASILPLDGDEPETHTIRFSEGGDDRRLLRDVVERLSSYQIWIGHNLAAFDLNFLYTRLMFHGYSPLPPALVFDTFQVAKGLGLATRKGLGNLIDFLGLDGVKTTIYSTSWNRVRSPYKDEFDEAMSAIVYHVENDVIANRALFDVLYPWAMLRHQNPFKLTKLRGAFREEARP